MKRYNRIPKSLIPDIIPALEGAHEKWIRGESQTEKTYVDWWWAEGKFPCSLCHFKDNHKEKCPLADKPCGHELNGTGCAIEWNRCKDAIRNNDFPEYHKQSALMRDRIGGLLNKARDMHSRTIYAVKVIANK